MSDSSKPRLPATALDPLTGTWTNAEPDPEHRGVYWAHIEVDLRFAEGPLRRGVPARLDTGANVSIVPMHFMTDSPLVWPDLEFSEVDVQSFGGVVQKLRLHLGTHILFGGVLGVEQVFTTENKVPYAILGHDFFSVFQTTFRWDDPPRFTITLAD